MLNKGWSVASFASPTDSCVVQRLSACLLEIAVGSMFTSLIRCPVHSPPTFVFVEMGLKVN